MNPPIVPGHALHTASGLLVVAVRDISDYFPATVRMFAGGKFHALSPDHAAWLGAQLIAAAAVASGRLDSADPQDVLDRAQHSIAFQARAALHQAQRQT